MDCPICNSHCHNRICEKCGWIEDPIPLELQEGMDQVFRIDGDGRLILLAEEVLTLSGKPRPSIHHRIKHVDGNYLNNTRKNLRWYLPDKSKN